MAQYRSFAQPRGFQEARLPDVASKLRERDQQQLRDMREAANYDMQQMERMSRAMQYVQQVEARNREMVFETDQANRDRIQNQIMKNYDAKIANVVTENKSRLETLGNLGKFSATAAETYGKVRENIEEGRKLAISETIYQTGITVKEMVEFQKLSQNMNQQSLAENAFIKDLVNRTGSSIQQIEFLVKNSQSKNWNESTQLAQKLGTDYLPYLYNQLETPFQVGDQQISLQEAQRTGNLDAQENILFQIRNKYRTESGMLNMSAQAAESYINPTMRNVENQFRSEAFAVKRKLVASAANEARMLGISQMVDSGGAAALATWLNNSPNPALDKADALTWFETVASGPNAGNYAPIWQELQNQTVVINGQSTTFGELNKNDPRVISVNNGFMDARRRALSEIQLGEQERLTQREQFEKAIIRQAEEQGIELTDADIEGIKAEADKRYGGGYTSSYLDNYIQNNTVNARYREQTEKQLEDLANRGLLTEERLMKMAVPMSVKSRYMGIARQTSADRQANGNFKPQMDALAALAKSPPTIQAKPDGTYHWSVSLMTQQLQNDFLTKYSELKAAGDPNAVGNAFTFVQQKFQAMASNSATFSQDKSNLGGYSMFINQKPSASAGVGAARMQWVQSNLGRLKGDALDSNGAIFTVSELNEIERDMAKPGFKMDPMAEYVGRLLGVDPLTVINRQRLAAGKSEVKLPESTVQFNNQVNPVLKRMLDAYQTPQISARSMMSTRTFNPGLIPNGYGEIITKEAAAAGVPPGEIAALMEIESSFNPNARSRTGALGLMQIQPDAHPGYKGGLDPAANINYGAQYYAKLRKMFGGDPVKAAGAYNAGPGRFDEYLRTGRPLPEETVNHMRKFSQTLAKYGDGTQLQSRYTMRGSMQGMGRVAFEKPVSVNFEAANGQPGVDLWFESKRFPAVLNGVVKDVSREPGYGNYIVIESTDPNTGMKVDVLYSHLADGIALTPGQQIYAGDIIGTQGGTGNVRSADGTIASIDFLAPAPRGSKSMVPYPGFNQLRRWVVDQLQR